MFTRSHQLPVILQSHRLYSGCCLQGLCGSYVFSAAQVPCPDADPPPSEPLTRPDLPFTAQEIVSWTPHLKYYSEQSRSAFYCPPFFREGGGGGERIISHSTAPIHGPALRLTNPLAHRDTDLEHSWQVDLPRPQSQHPADHAGWASKVQAEFLVMRGLQKGGFVLGHAAASSALDSALMREGAF